MPKVTQVSDNPGPLPPSLEPFPISLSLQIAAMAVEGVVSI